MKVKVTIKMSGEEVVQVLDYSSPWKALAEIVSKSSEYIFYSKDVIKTDGKEIYTLTMSDGTVFIAEEAKDDVDR